MFFKNLRCIPEKLRGYSEASKSKPQIMLATPMKAIAAKAMKLSEDANICTPMMHCTEKNVAKPPENMSRTTRYLRIEANTSKS